MSEVVVRMEKIPKNCDDSCWGYLSGECPWSDHVDGYTMNGGRPRNCPIVCILPDEHGDLIDRSLLCADLVGVILSHSGLGIDEVIARQDAVIAAERKDDAQID